MPSPHPIYEENVPKTHCRVRCVNNPSVIKMVERKPVFGHKSLLVHNALEEVFKNFLNFEFERVSENTLETLIKVLDMADMEAIDFGNTAVVDSYVDQLVHLTHQITAQCGFSFHDLDVAEEAASQLKQAWTHFLRLVWMRKPRWERLVKCVSDENRQWNKQEDYYLEDIEAEIEKLAINMLLVPIQVWASLIRLACEKQAGRTYI